MVEGTQQQKTNVGKIGLCEIAEQNGLKVVDVPSDGNCGLHAIVMQLLSQGIASDVSSLRAEAVAYLRCNPALMDENFLIHKADKSVECYLLRQSKSGQFVDEIMLRAIAACIERDIHVLHDNGYTTELRHKPTATVSVETVPALPLHIGQIGEVHYVSLHKVDLREEVPTNQETCPQTPACDQVRDIEMPLPNTDYIAPFESRSEQNIDWPSIWSVDAWNEKKKKYPFLYCKDGKLGCKACRDVGNLHVFSVPGMSMTVEWVNAEIAPSGKGRAEQLRSIRKKIFEHKTSLTHNTAEKIIKESENQRIEKVVVKMCADDEELTSKAFRTAYYLAKNDKPLNDYQGLLELQEINGAGIGSGLRSRYSANEIVKHVSKEMRQKACQNIIETGGCISVLIDEATTISNKSTLVVYIKCTPLTNSEPQFMFLDLVELEDQSADTITRTLLHVLAKYGFNDDYLRNHLVAFASDGASVMTGRKAGVAAQLVAKYPNIITWHCLNHRLELAVGDAADATQGINHFRSFMDSLYSLYSRSPKTQTTIENEALELNVQVKKIGRVLNTRWVASSFRTVAAVWNNFQALAAHFKAGADPASQKFEQALKSKYSGLLKKLCSPQFVQDLGLMYDCLEELKFLSESLQKRNMNLPEADKLIRRAIRRIECLKDQSGPKMTESKSYAAASIFDKTPLKTNAKHISINQNQFLQSLADNLRQRLLTSDTARVTAGKTVPNERQDNQIIAQLAVISPDYWPNDMCVNYGEAELRLLCTRFRLSYATVRDGYCDFKDSGGRQVTGSFKPMLNSINTIPVSTAECERGFSAMNIILSELRSVMLIDHVSALMFIKIQGPPLGLWKPQDYVKSWLLKHRSATDSRTRVAMPTCAAEKLNPDPLWDIL